MKKITLLLIFSALSISFLKGQSFTKVDSTNYTSNIANRLYQLTLAESDFTSFTDKTQLTPLNFGGYISTDFKFFNPFIQLDVVNGNFDQNNSNQIGDAAFRFEDINIGVGFMINLE